VSVPILVRIAYRSLFKKNNIFAGSKLLSNEKAERHSGCTFNDIELLSRYVDIKASSPEGYYTDFFGIKTPIRVVSSLAHRSGVVNTDIPIPDDSVHANTIEYCCLFDAIDQSDDTFTMFELGAGWGPWMTCAAVACKKKEFSRINIIGVEGESSKIALIKEMLFVNGLRNDDDELSQLHENVYSEIIHGVVAEADGTVEFPVVEIEHYGASLLDVAAVKNHSRVSVPGYSIETLIKDYSKVDFIHLDLQGYEVEAIRSAIDALNSKVRYLCIGTHSRKIEGDLIDILMANKWELLRESPCMFLYGDGVDISNQLVDLTDQDGLQFWKNTGV